jgi:hypothetical protein
VRKHDATLLLGKRNAILYRLTSSYFFFLLLIFQEKLLISGAKATQMLPAKSQIFAGMV